MVKTMQIQGTLTQIVNMVTTFQVTEGTVKSSIIDHVYTNCQDKLRDVELVAVGDSDHLGLVVTKLTNIPKEHQQTFRARKHKPVALKHDLLLNNLNDTIDNFKELYEAGEAFHRELTFCAN